MMLARSSRIFLCLTFAILVAGCAPAPAGQELLVAAASSLTNPFQDLASLYKHEGGVSVAFTFGSTGQLAQQIRNGAPFDIFAAADARHIDQLIDEDFLIPNSRAAFAVGRLVLIQNMDLDLNLAALEDLASANPSRVVIANPDHAPYGIAAKETLSRLLLWDELSEKIVFAETVQQANQFVATGNAPLGLVARSSVVDPRMILFIVPEELHSPIQHVAAISKRSEQVQAAEGFLAFLQSEASSEILAEYGLEGMRDP
jgi:molybdate transport system substrate-binding protein